MGAAITLGVGVVVLGVPFDLGARRLAAARRRDGRSASSSILAIGVLLAAICMQTRQESWSYPEAVGGRAVPRLAASSSRSSSCRRRVQAIGLLTPLTWWIEGVRQALFPGGVSSIGGAGSLFATLTGSAAPDRAEIVVALLATGSGGYTRGDRRLPGERPPSEGSRAARPDHRLLSRARPRRPRRPAHRGGPMRIYEGSPRQDFEEVFRSIGAFIDQRGMREILLVEAPDGFIVQGIVVGRRGRRRLVRVAGHADARRR